MGSEKAKELMLKMESKNEKQEHSVSEGVLTEEELQKIDDIVYYKGVKACRKANDWLYHGLIKDLDRVNSDNEAILEQLSQIRLILKALVDNE